MASSLLMDRTALTASSGLRGYKLTLLVRFWVRIDLFLLGMIGASISDSGMVIEAMWIVSMD